MADTESRLSEVEERLERLELRIQQLDRARDTDDGQHSGTGDWQSTVKQWATDNPVLAVLGGTVVLVLVIHILG